MTVEKFSYYWSRSKSIFGNILKQIIQDNFFPEYYHFEDSDVSPSKLVNDLFYTRDINQVDKNY